MLRRLAFLLFMALPVAVLACEEEEPRPRPAGEGTTTPLPSGSRSEAGTSEAGATDAGTDADTTCTTIAFGGAVIDRTGINGDPPVSTGGTITDGRYDLTVYSVYVGVGGVAGPTGVTGQSTIVINAGKIEQALRIAGNTPAKETRTLSSYSATGSSVLVTNICPATGTAVTYQYTANDAAIILTDPLSKEAFTFTKR